MIQIRELYHTCLIGTWPCVNTVRHRWALTSRPHNIFFSARGNTVFFVGFFLIHLISLHRSSSKSFLPTVGLSAACCSDRHGFQLWHLTGPTQHREQPRDRAVAARRGLCCGDLVPETHRIVRAPLPNQITLGDMLCRQIISSLLLSFSMSRSSSLCVAI